MAFPKSNFSGEMEFFKAQLKNAADVFDKMPEFEQIKALDAVKDLFQHLSSSLTRTNNDAKLMNGDISLIEQDLINCLVVGNQQDDILSWNTSPHLMCEKSSAVEEIIENPECAVDERSKECGSLHHISNLQLERENIIEGENSAMDSSCNTDLQCCQMVDDENDVSSGLCNSDENFTERDTSMTRRAKKSSVTRRTSLRLANKKFKADEPTATTSEEEQVSENGTEKEKEKEKEKAVRTKKSKRCAKKQNETYVCDKCGTKFQEEAEYEAHAGQHEVEADTEARDDDEETMEEGGGGGDGDAPTDEDEQLHCDECKLKFTHLQNYRKHMNGHNRNNCKLCSARFAKRKALCRHLRTEHTINEPEKLYECPHCERKFVKRPSLYVHLKEHAKGKIVCLKCGLVCDTDDTFDRHMLKHTQEAKFHCSKCNESFSRRQQYEQHLTGHDKYKCTLCDINFSTKKHFLKHKRVVHGIQTREEKKHVCFICQKRFQRPMLLEVHMRLHTGEKPIQCTHCDKNFRTPKALAKHMKTAAHLKATGQDENEAEAEAEACELDKPYLCAQCGTRFYRRQGLVRHMQQLHSDERPYTCPYCDYSCKCKTNLKRHVELHTADRRFVCELCGSSFHARATLKEHHAYVHSEDRNFVCSVCGKGFKGRSGLRRHVRIHSDARPYVCYCSQSYKRMSHLKRHMIAVHGALFKSKRVTKIMEEENENDNDNSQSSSNEDGGSNGGSNQCSNENENENDDGDGDGDLLLDVHNAVVDLLQISSSRQVPGHELQELLSLPSVSPLSQPAAHPFGADMAYPHDYPLSSSSSSSSDVANHFTFCMSLSQSGFGLPVAPHNSFFPPTNAAEAEAASLLMSNLPDGSELAATDKMTSAVPAAVPKMFAHLAT